MATKTAGTLLTTTLTAIQYSPDPTTMSEADLATVAQGIFKDGGFGSPDGIADGSANKIAAIFPGAFTRAGLLFIPGRNRTGPLLVAPGDWVATDGFGNAFLIPQRAMPKTLALANCTTTNGSPNIVAPSSVLALGWQNGTHVTGTNIPAGSVIGDLAANGLSFNLYAIATGAKVNATGSAANVNITAGTFTHS